MSYDATQLTTRYMQALNDGDLDAIDETRTADYLVHQPPDPDATGLAAHREFVVQLRQMVPDVRMTVDDLFAHGDMIVVRYTMAGTHLGQSSIVPIPPTGKKVRCTGCAVDRVVGGKIAETWNHVDYLGLLMQLGVVPPLG